LEIIVVDAGSTDDTPQRLPELARAIPNLRHYHVEAPGLARALNIGADLARHAVILFLDQDAGPANDDFFRVHASLHHRYPDTNLAVLGTVAGSPRTSEGITRTMAKILGRGGAQFGDFDLTPYAFVSWPYFHTANVSVKKAFVPDWILDGFNADAIGSPYEDLELACRISKSPSGLRLYYNPAAAVARTRHASIAEHMDYQFSLGKALVNLVERNPELTMDCGPEAFLGALRARRDSLDASLTTDYRLLLDGVKAWTRVLEGTRIEPWHAELKAATLEVCLLDGFASAWTAQGGDVATALPLVAECLRRRVDGFGAFVQPFAQ
jgi:hypothetical protein